MGDMVDDGGMAYQAQPDQGIEVKVVGDMVLVQQWFETILLGHLVLNKAATRELGQLLLTTTEDK